MKKCPKCGYENQNDSADCPQCGIIYEKFMAMHKEKEEREEDVEEVEEESEQKEETPHPDFEPGEKVRFDIDQIISSVNDFFRQYYLQIIISCAAILVLLTLILILTSGIKGETGIVSWKNAIGEEGESALLFDYIGLLKEPELPDDEDLDSVLCDMPNGSRVKVLKVQGKFLQVKVLNGKCSGITGYILFEMFEQQ